MDEDCFGNLKIHYVAPPVQLFSVIKEGDEQFLELSPHINKDYIFNAKKDCQYMIGVSIFGWGNNKSYFIDELIRLTADPGDKSLRKDPSGVKLWPVNGVIDGKKVAIMFIIGEEAGMCNRNRSYDLKILEACLSLSHIALLNSLGVIRGDNIFYVLEANAEVQKHEKQLTFQRIPFCILGRNTSIEEYDTRMGPSATEGANNKYDSLKEAFPEPITQYIADITTKETNFRRNLANFSNLFTKLIRQVLEDAPEDTLNLNSFWSVMSSFKKRHSETQKALEKFNSSITREKERILELIEREECDPEEEIAKFDKTFFDQLDHLRESDETNTFGQSENILKEAIRNLKRRYMNKESHVYLVRMEKVKDEAEREMTDLWHMLHETAQIESTVNENSKETLNEIIRNADEKIRNISKEGRKRDVPYVIEDSDRQRAGLDELYHEVIKEINCLKRDMERQKQSYGTLAEQDKQFLNALQNAKYRGLRDDAYRWNTLDYRNQVELWAQSGFEKKLLNHVIEHLPERNMCARSGKKGQEGFQGKRGQDGGVGADGTRGMPGKNGIELTFTLEGSPEELYFKNWLKDPFNMEDKSENVWMIDLRGQDGGNGAPGMKGGNGGVGVDGFPGYNGQYLEDLNGQKGGKGGNGGAGGNGGDGGDGGNGGILYIETRKPELLMLLEFDLRGGFGGRGGLGGMGGRPGQGGPGGQGFVQEPAAMYTLQGFHGRPGLIGEPGAPPERPAGLNGRPGCHGLAGRFIIRVEASGESAVEEFGIGRYDVEVESFEVEPVLDDGIIEQNEVVAVKNIVLGNPGGITLPKGAVLTFESNNHDVRPISEPIPLPSLPPGQSKKLDDVYYFRVHQWVDDINKVGRMRSQCFFHSKARLLGRTFLSSVREGKFIIKSPITVSDTTAPECGCGGATTKLSLKITNESKFPHGTDAPPWDPESGEISPEMLPSNSGEIDFEVLVEEETLTIKSVSIINESQPPDEQKQKRQTRGLSPGGSRTKKVATEGCRAKIDKGIHASGDIPLIKPSASYRIDIEVELSKMAPVGHQCQVVFTLKHRGKIVENRHLSVRATQSFDPYASPADILYFSLPHQQETELCGWTLLFSSLSLSCQFWDVGGHGGISFEDGDKTKKRDCSFWTTHEGSTLVFPFRDRSDLDLLDPNDVLSFLSCQPLPLPLVGDDVSIVQGRVHPGSVIFLGLKKNVIYQWLFSSPLCSVGLKEMKVPPKYFDRLTGKLRDKAIAKGEKEHHDLYRLNAEVKRYDNFAAMDESVFYDIQFDQKYDWEKDGNEVVEESEEMVEQEVDENSVEGVTNQERRHNEAKTSTTTMAGTLSSAQGSTVTTSTFVSDSASTADSMQLGESSQASSSSMATAVVAKSTKVSSTIVSKNEKAEKLQMKIEQDLFLSKDGKKINAFAVYAKLPLPIHTKLFTITAPTLPSLCCNENVFSEDMKEAIVEEMFDIDGDTLDIDIYSSLTFLIFVSQLHDVLSSLMMAMSPAKKLATAKYLLERIETEKGVDEADLDTVDLTTVSSEASSATAISDSESENWSETESEMTYSMNLELEEDENAEKKKIELEEIENTKKAGKLRKQKRNAKFPDTNFEFEKPWEWQFFYLKKNRGIFKKGAGVSQHNLVQMLYSSIVEDLAREGQVVKHSYPIRSQFRSLIQYRAKTGIERQSSDPTSNPRWSTSSPSSSSLPQFSHSATFSAPVLTNAPSSPTFKAESSYGVGAPTKEKKGFFLKRTQSVASSFSDHDEKILRSRYKKEMGTLKNDKTAYFLERAASNDLDMIKYMVESKQMKTTATLKSEPKKNPMGLKKGDSLSDVLQRSHSNEVKMYLNRMEAKVEETKIQTEVAKKKSAKIVSFAPEFPALQETLDFLTTALEEDATKDLMFQAFAREVLSRLRKILPPQKRMVLKKDDLEKAIGALKLTTNGATERERKLIRKYTKEMKLKSDYSLEKMRMYSGIQLPFYESLALIPLRDLRVKQVKKEVVETAVGRRRYALWQPRPMPGLDEENLQLRNDSTYFPYPSHHHLPFA